MSKLIQPSKGQTYQVSISGSTSPSLLFCQLPENFEYLLTFTSKLNEAVKSVYQKPAIQLGSTCCAKYGDEYFRAMVINVGKNFVRVFYPDYGTEDNVLLSQVCAIPNSFVSHPPMCFRCALNVDPLGDDWSPEALNEFYASVEDTMTIKVVSILDYIYVVDLISSGGINVGSSLIQKNLAQATEVEENSNFIVAPISRPIQNSTSVRLPKPLINAGFSTKVIITWVINPQEVYCQFESDNQSFLDQLAKVQNTYDNMPSTPFKVVENEICAAKFHEDDAWYRAEIKKVNGQKVVVQFVDYGNSATTTYASLRPLIAEIATLPRQAVRCFLSGIAPSRELAVEDAARIFGGTPKCIFDSENEDGSFWVTMYQGKTCINEQLVLEGLAQPLGGVDDQVIVNGELLPMEALSISDDLSFLCREFEAYSVNITFADPTLFNCKIQDQILLLQDAFTRLDLSAPIPNLHLGLLAVVEVDSIWYRVKVLSLENGVVGVSYIDYGEEDALENLTYFNLTPELYSIPAQAFNATLYDYPAGAAKESFAQYIDESKLYIALVRDADSKLVQLFDATSEEASQTVGELLYGVTPDEATSDKFTLFQVVFHEGYSQVVSKKLFEKSDYFSTWAPEVLTIYDEETGHAAQNFKFIKISPGHIEAFGAVVSSMNPAASFTLKYQTKSISYTPFQLEVNIDYAGMILYAPSPDNITFQLFDHITSLAEYSTSLNAFYAEPQNQVVFTDEDVLLPGDICIAKFSSDGLWYRARIVSHDPDTNNFNIIFVDYGNIEAAEKATLAVIHPIHLTTPLHILSCSLGTFHNWNQDVFDNLINEEKALALKLLSSGEVDSVDILDDSTSIKEKLLDNGEAHSNGPQQVLGTELPAAPEYQSLLPFNVQTTPAKAIINVVNTNTNFYALLSDESEGLSQFSDELNEFYSKIGNEEYTKPVWKKGELGCCIYENEWYRCQILVLTGDEAQVIYLDYGSADMTPLSALKELDARFYQVAPFAYSCILEDSYLEEDVDYSGQTAILEFLRPQDGPPFFVKLNFEVQEIHEVAPATTADEPTKLPPLEVPSTPIEVYISLAIDQTDFFLQLEENNAQEYNDQLNQHYFALAKPLSKAFQIGDICVSKFTDDQLWYRAEVLSIEGDTASVRYIDYGNTEEVPLSELKVLDAYFFNSPPLAYRCELSEDSNPNLITITEAALKATFLSQDSDRFVVRLEEIVTSEQQQEELITDATNQVCVSLKSDLKLKLDGNNLKEVDEGNGTLGEEAVDLPEDSDNTTALDVGSYTTNLALDANEPIPEENEGLPSSELITDANVVASESPKSLEELPQQSENQEEVDMIQLDSSAAVPLSQEINYSETISEAQLEINEMEEESLPKEGENLSLETTLLEEEEVTPGAQDRLTLSKQLENLESEVESLAEVETISAGVQQDESIFEPPLESSSPANETSQIEEADERDVLLLSETLEAVQLSDTTTEAVLLSEATSEAVQLSEVTTLKNVEPSNETGREIYLQLAEEAITNDQEVIPDYKETSELFESSVIESVGPETLNETITNNVLVVEEEEQTPETVPELEIETDCSETQKVEMPQEPVSNHTPIFTTSVLSENTNQPEAIQNSVAKAVPLETVANDENAFVLSQQEIIAMTQILTSKPDQPESQAAKKEGPFTFEGGNLLKLSDSTATSSSIKLNNSVTATPPALSSDPKLGSHLTSPQSNGSQEPLKLSNTDLFEEDNIVTANESDCGYVVYS